MIKSRKLIENWLWRFILIRIGLQMPQKLSKWLVKHMGAWVIHKRENTMTCLVKSLISTKDLAISTPMSYSDSSSVKEVLKRYLHKHLVILAIDEDKVIHLHRWWVQWCKECKTVIAAVVQECSQLAWVLEAHLFSNHQVSADLKWGHSSDEGNNRGTLKIVVVHHLKKRGRVKTYKWGKINNNLEMFSPMVSCKALVNRDKDNKEVKEVQKYILQITCKWLKSFQINPLHSLG